MRIQLLGSAVLALSLVAAAPAIGNPTAPAKKDPNEKIICKSEGTVGSRIRERICKTRAEWELGRSKARDVLDGMPKEQFQSPDRAGAI